MAGMVYDKIIKYKVNAVCDGPLHIGSSQGGKEEVLVHPVSQNPFIQASEIAGIFRGAYGRYQDEDKVNLVFGARRVAEGENANDFSSKVKFSDGKFAKENLHMELRPHVKIDRASGTVDSANGSGQKFDMEYIGAGAEFSFEVYLFIKKDKEDFIKEDFDMLFAEMNNGGFLFGGKKSSGAGKVLLESLYVKEFDMTDSEDRKLWMNEELLKESDYISYKDKMPSVEHSGQAYSITINGKTEGAIQVKGIAVSKFGKGAPDSENIRNSKGEYIIPGSSVKGTFRNQMEKIAGYIQKESIISEIFGKGGEIQKEGKTGNMIFSDTVIDNQEASDVLRHRIHIDKFTGGVFDHGLFSESNTCGKVDFNISILDKNNPDAALGLLIFAIRDMAVQMMSFGNGYSVGKGFILVDKITIQQTGTKKQAVIEMSDGEFNICDADKIIDNAIAALKGVPE